MIRPFTDFIGGGHEAMDEEDGVSGFGMMQKIGRTDFRPFGFAGKKVLFIF
jgi:hypothetical protein